MQVVATASIMEQYLVKYTTVLKSLFDCFCCFSRSAIRQNNVQSVAMLAIANMVGVLCTSYFLVVLTGSKTARDLSTLNAKVIDQYTCNLRNNRLIPVFQMCYLLVNISSLCGNFGCTSTKEVIINLRSCINLWHIRHSQFSGCQSSTTANTRHKSCRTNSGFKSLCLFVIPIPRQNAPISIRLNAVLNTLLPCFLCTFVHCSKACPASTFCKVSYL